MDSRDRVWRERGLKAAVLAGDESAWRTLYEESFDGLYAYVLWRLAGQRDSTDEVVQETWLTAVRRIRSFDPELGSLLGWLRGIAANVLRNNRRKEAGRVRQVQSLDAEIANTLPAEAAQPHERQERIAETLNALPNRYEAVLRAKYLDQLSVAQIAEAWRETPKAIESLLSRAREAFRQAYLKEEQDDARTSEQR